MVLSLRALQTVAVLWPRYGGRWGKVAKVLPGRSEVAARQRWDVLSQLSQQKKAETQKKVEKGCAPAAKRDRSPTGGMQLMPSPRPKTSFFQVGRFFLVSNAGVTFENKSPGCSPL